MDNAKSSSSAASSPYHDVYENFKRLQEFGWFMPAPSGSYFYATSDGDALGYKQAAVMFLLSHHNGSLQVLMTKRSNTVRTHKGRPLW